MHNLLDNQRLIENNQHLITTKQNYLQLSIIIFSSTIQISNFYILLFIFN